MTNKNARFIIFFSLAAVLRNLLGIIRAKIVSIWIGVKGVGILGQIVSFYNFQSNIIDLGVYPFLINKLSGQNPEKNIYEYTRILIISFFILITSNLIFLTTFFLLRSQLNLLVFDSNEFLTLFTLLIFLAPIYSFSYFIENTVRARQNFKTLAIGQNLTALVGLISIIPLIWKYKIYGIVLNLYLFLIFNLIFFAYYGRQYFGIISWKFFRISRGFIFEVVKLCSVFTIRKVLVFISIIIFRIIIVQFAGMEENGYFQSIWSITNYINIIIMAFSVYLFPTLSSFRDRENFIQSLNENLKILLYILYPVIAIIMAFPDIFLKILFSSDFIKMKIPLNFLMFLKFSEGIYIFFLFVFLSSTRLKEFLLLEGTKSIFLIISSYFLVKYFFLSGAILSLGLTQILSFLLLIILLFYHPYLKISPENKKLIFRLMFGLIILIYPFEIIGVGKLIQVILFVIYFIKNLEIENYLNVIKGLLIKK